MVVMPNWKCVENFGDVNPIDHGGYFIFVDQDGEYDPEAAILTPPEETEDVETGECDDDGDPITIEVGNWELRRFSMDKCFYNNGVLSDNPFHGDHPVWFAKDLDSICSTMDVDKKDVIAKLCSDDPIERAWGYYAINGHWGPENLGCGEPVIFEDRNEVEQWCKEVGIEV